MDPFISKPNFLGVSNTDMSLEENGALKNVNLVDKVNQVLTSGDKDTTKDTSGGIITQAGKTADAIKQAEAIAKEKMKDLNAFDLKEATKIICGSARSMGIEVKE